MKPVFIFVGVALLLAGCVPVPVSGSSPAVPQNGFTTATNLRPQISVVDSGSRMIVDGKLMTTAGQKIRVEFLHNALNPDCSMNDGLKPALKITGQPRHGALVTIDEQELPIFQPSSPFYKCNDTALQGEALYYTANAGYVGPDSISYEIFLSDGHEMDINATIEVK